MSSSYRMDMQSDTVRIRPARPDDLDTLRYLYRDTITTVNIRDYTQEQVLLWSDAHKDVEAWKKRLQEHLFFVAELDEVIVGFVSVTDAGHLYYLYVHKDYQGQRIGTMLMEKALSVFEEQQFEEVWAEVSITARPFFARFGFVLTETYSVVVDGIRFDDAVMRKKMGGG